MIPRIRRMVLGDVEPVSEMIERANWGARRSWFEFAVDHPACQPIVAELDGALVGTGVATVNGRVGWVGTIFVAPELRGQGLGRALTQDVIDRLESAGCRTLVLVATREGRLLYERMGFELLVDEHVMEVSGLPPLEAAAGSTIGHVIRPYRPGDLEPIAALDRAGTGEDRRHALARFATADSAKVVVGSGGRLEGFVVRAPWGGGATIARTTAAALAILDARRRAAGPEGRVRVGVMATNVAGLEALTRAGLGHAWSAPRMARGEPLDWRPDWIYGQLNHAMG